MEVAEDFFGPEVDAAFAGIAMREFDDGDALRPEKENERDDPEPDGHAAVCGDRWDDVEIENGDDEKENEVPTAEHAAQVRRFARPDAVCVVTSFDNDWFHPERLAKEIKNECVGKSFARASWGAAVPRPDMTCLHRI